jgi:hypothetical protein
MFESVYFFVTFHAGQICSAYLSWPVRRLTKTFSFFCRRLLTSQPAQMWCATFAVLSPVEAARGKPVNGRPSRLYAYYSVCLGLPSPKCEFRYICTDCRAMIENPKDERSAPLKCGYDPKSGEWEEWQKNILKTYAIKYYYKEWDKVFSSDNDLH